MTAHVDFTSQAFFRDPAAGIDTTEGAGPGGRDPVPDRRQGLDHDHIRFDGPRPEGRRDVHAAQGGRRRCRAALVDAGLRRRARQQHADHGRARPHAPAPDRRRGLPPPRGSRHGAAHSRHRRRSRRQAVRRRQPGRSGRALCAIAAAVGHLRAARPAAGRPPEVHRLGQHGRAARRGHRFRAHDRRPLADETLSGRAPAARPRARRRGPDRRACAGRDGRRRASAPTRWCRWSFCCWARARRPRPI